ncbi:MAG: hypothetical protein IPL08_05210 [Saprospiraceae bacterium]|nr:hypothetical protein [Saprospiraceae bacterium]
MKKLILIAFAVSILQAVNAQETEIGNKVILGGSINFLTQNNTYPISSLSINSGIGGIYSNSTDDTRNTTFAITPYFGKEINPKLFVGLQLDYRIGRYKAEFGQINSINFERNSNQIGIGLFTRHILYPNNKFSFFIQPYLEYNLLNEEEIQNSNVTQEEKANYFEVGAGLGILYNINSKIRATLRTGGLNYVNGKWEIKDTDKEKYFSSFGTNLNLSTIFFGFEIRI